MSGKRVNGNDPNYQARRRASGQSPYSSSNSRNRRQQGSAGSPSSHSGGDRPRPPQNGSRPRLFRRQAPGAPAGGSAPGRCGSS